MTNGVLEIPSEPTNPNAFNYRKFLLTQDIRYEFSANSIYSCKLGKETIYTRLIDYRKQSIEKIKDFFPIEISPFINALLFGYDDEMDESIVGLSHLLAISGLHVTILTGCIYFVLLRLGVTRERVQTHSFNFFACLCCNRWWRTICYSLSVYGMVVVILY